MAAPAEQPSSAPASAVPVADVSSLRCPMTWVRTKVALASVAPGARLDVVLGDGEMLRNVPGNARDEGHEVLGLDDLGGGRHVLRLRKSTGARAIAGASRRTE